MNALNSRLQSNLLFLGNIGYDIYIRNACCIYARPGGSAYNAACGMLASNGSGTAVASIGRSFGSQFLAKFAGSNVNILSREVEQGPDNLFVFEMDSSQADLVASSRFSVGNPGIPPFDLLADTPYRNLHVHLGTMPAHHASRIADYAHEVMPSASLSCNLYEYYLKQQPEATLDLAKRCLLVFVNSEEFQLLEHRGMLDDILHGRIVVRTSGSNGATCYADGIPVAAYTPSYRDAVCSIGAGDVFAGSFLSYLIRSRDMAQALAISCEIAALSVIDFGVEHVMRYRLKLQEPDPAINLLRQNVPHSALFKLMPAESEVVFQTVTEATGLFVVRDGALLLVRKPDDKSFVPGKLYVPGGKVEVRETPLECAKRELVEETGLIGGDFSLLGISYFPDPRKPGKLFRFFQYLVTETIGTPEPADDITECVWVDESRLDRAELFDMTWAQIFLGRVLGGMSA